MIRGAVEVAGTTGPDGASHHGVYDMALLSKVPGMRVLAPSSAQELAQMLHDAMSLADAGPIAIRYPRGAARQVSEHEVGSGLTARKAVTGSGTVCIVAVGKMLDTAEKAAAVLAAGGIEVTVWDARCCAPLDPDMIADAAARAGLSLRDSELGLHALRVAAQQLAHQVEVALDHRDRVVDLDEHGHADDDQVGVAAVHAFLSKVAVEVPQCWRRAAHGVDEVDRDAVG